MPSVTNTPLVESLEVQEPSTVPLPTSAIVHQQRLKSSKASQRPQLHSPIYAQQRF